MVTIGIPFYNPGAFLELAILSVLNQTFIEWKLILIDDGSSDVVSNNIAQKYILLDTRISMIADGQNRGLVFRLNQLSSMVKTKYYARMDADDVMHPFRIERQVAVLQKNSSLDACGSEAFIINGAGEITGQLNSYWPKEKNSLLIKNSLIHPSLLFVSEWSLNNAYQDNWVRMEDLELWYRTFDKFKIEILNEKLLFYRVGSNIKGKYVKTEKFKRRFFRHLLNSSQISFSNFIYANTISLGKQLIVPLLSNFSFFSKSDILWEDELKGLYYLEEVQKLAYEKK